MIPPVITLRFYPGDVEAVDAVRAAGESLRAAVASLEARLQVELELDLDMSLDTDAAIEAIVKRATIT